MNPKRTEPTKPLSLSLLLGLFALSALAGGAVLGGCAGDPVGEEAAPESEEAAGSEAGAVEYEPAYPEDVSAGELSEEDTAQQAAHTHADGSSHSHGEGSDHEHGEGEGEGDHEHDGHEDDEH